MDTEYIEYNRANPDNIIHKFIETRITEVGIYLSGLLANKGYPIKIQDVFNNGNPCLKLVFKNKKIFFSIAVIVDRLYFEQGDIKSYTLVDVNIQSDGTISKVYRRKDFGLTGIPLFLGLDQMKDNFDILNYNEFDVILKTLAELK